jgi:acetylornithine/LysW-gamma-L-lysine aminotransferase
MTAEDAHLAVSFPQKPVGFVEGRGANLTTSDGRTVVDLGGASHGVANFGHAHPRIARAIAQQSARLVHTVQTVRSPVREAFLDRLHRLLPDRLERTFLANSGAEAVEAAFKYAHAATGRTKIVAARNGFHGRTLGALAATHRPQYRRPFEAMLHHVDFVRYNDIGAMEEAVDEQTAAVILEPVQGEGGVVVADPGYLEAAGRAAHKAGALLVVDEIQTGLGRTGHDLAVQAGDAKPDILLLGKSLAGGLPIGTASMTADVAAAMPPGGHGTTFGGSPLVMAAAAEALQILADEKLAEAAMAKGAHVRRRLEALDAPLVREVRGRGLMIGIDLRIRPQAVLARLLDAGFLALPAGSTVVRLLPPLTIGRSDLDAAVDALGTILGEPSLKPGAEVAG